MSVRVSYAEGTALGLNWYDGDYNCWDGGPCYVHEAIDLASRAGSSSGCAITTSTHAVALPRRAA